MDHLEHFALQIALIKPNDDEGSDFQKYVTLGPDPRVHPKMHDGASARKTIVGPMMTKMGGFCISSSCSGLTRASISHIVPYCRFARRCMMDHLEHFAMQIALIKADDDE